MYDSSHILVSYILNAIVTHNLVRDPDGKIALPTNIQTHRSMPASINFLGPAEPGIKSEALGLNEKRAGE